MRRRFYHTGQFARKVSVSARTLRYYDSVGLLSPTQHTDAGYRLYSDEDLARLQQILALKFLGFSLEEIQACLHTGPQRLQEALAAQKAMMRERRAQLDTIIQALDETERVMESGGTGWDSIIRVMEAIQMQQKDEWQGKYFTPEQRRTMEEISSGSYSDQARQRLAARGEWTEADQREVDDQYARLGRELRRLVAVGADPASPEAQAAAQLQRDLLAGFTQGDPEIAAGLRAWWQQFEALPEEQRPFKPPYGKEEAEFLGKAGEIAEQRRKEERDG